MSDHLPECKALDPMPEATRMFYSTSRQWFWEHGCICDRLRSCEQRVFQEQIKGRQHDMVMAYLRGLDAAREAVENMPAEPTWEAQEERIAALAAIDALREEQK